MDKLSTNWICQAGVGESGVKGSIVDVYKVYEKVK